MKRPLLQETLPLCGHFCKKSLTGMRLKLFGFADFISVFWKEDMKMVAVTEGEAGSGV